MMCNIDDENDIAELSTPLVTPTSIHTNISTTIDNSVLSINSSNEKTSPALTYHNLNLPNQKNLNEIIYEKVSTTLAYVKRIEGKLEGIETLLNGKIGHTRSTAVDNNILTKFPMKTVSDVEEIERKLTTDENFLKQMVIFIFFMHYCNFV